MTCLTEPAFLRLPPRPFCIPKPRPLYGTTAFDGAAMGAKLYPPVEMKPGKLEVLLTPVFVALPPSAATAVNALTANPLGAI